MPVDVTMTILTCTRLQTGLSTSMWKLGKIWRCGVGLQQFFLHEKFGIRWDNVHLSYNYFLFHGKTSQFVASPRPQWKTYNFNNFSSQRSLDDTHLIWSWWDKLSSSDLKVGALNLEFTRGHCRAILPHPCWGPIIHLFLTTSDICAKFPEFSSTFSLSKIRFCSNNNNSRIQWDLCTIQCLGPINNSYIQ